LEGELVNNIDIWDFADETRNDRGNKGLEETI